MKPGRLFPVALILVGAIVIFIGIYRKHKPAFTGKEKSVAILPFVNADTAKVNDYLSEGMTSEIVHRLSGISGLRVVPASRVRRLQQEQHTPMQSAAILKVASVLEGKIRRNGQVLSIHVDLIDAGSGDEIWSRDFETRINDLFSFQNELAEVVAAELHADITQEEKNHLHARPTQNLEAYDQYLKGIYYWNKRDAVSLRKGIEFFNLAILLDSTYARAWSGIADCYSALGYGSHDAPGVDFLKAETAARKAVSLDSTLAEPYTSLGYIDFYYYWDWGKAEKAFLTAIRLNPDYPLAHDAYVYFLTARERYAEAAVEMGKASALDPASAFIQTDQGFALYYAGHYDRAIPALKEVLIRYPKFPLAWLWLGRSYQEKKYYQESISAYRMAMNKDSVWPVALAANGFVYGITNRYTEANQILEQMKNLMKYRYVTPYGIALIYAGIRDKDRTFEWLNRAYTDRANWLVWLKLDPRWAYIRNDPRYISLVQKIGLNRETAPARN